MAIPIRRRELVLVLGGIAAAWPLAARAQQPTTPVIGFISGRSPDESEAVVAFRQGLAEAGYVEGQNVQIAFRWAEGHYERLPMMAADLARRQVTAILATGGNPPVFAVKAATATIPIVFIIGSDPVEVGFVASVNRPGGNITGVSLFTSLLVAKRLELLRELVPTATIIAFLVNPDNSNARPDTAVMQAAAARLGQKLIVLSARTEQNIDLAFASLGQQQATALVVNTDAFFLNPAQSTCFTGGALCDSHDPRFAGVHRRRWSDQLWNEPCGRLSPSRHLRRPDSQRCEAGRFAGRAADQI